jgi:hypothetical protein
MSSQGAAQMGWSRVLFEGDDRSPESEMFRASLLQLLYRLPDEEGDHIGVYVRSTLSRETEFVLSPDAADIVGRLLPEYDLEACGRPPSGLLAIFGGSFASDPAWFELPIGERNRQLDEVRLSPDEADMQHADLLMDLGFIADDRQPARLDG